MNARTNRLSLPLALRSRYMAAPMGPGDEYTFLDRLDPALAHWRISSMSCPK